MEIQFVLLRSADGEEDVDDFDAEVDDDALPFLAEYDEPADEWRWRDCWAFRRFDGGRFCKYSLRFGHSKLLAL
jgi:hypothetical protein